MKTVNGLFVHFEWDVALAKHGDDFIAEGEEVSLRRVSVLLTANFTVKILERVGPGAAMEGRY